MFTNKKILKFIAGICVLGLGVTIFHIYKANLVLGRIARNYCADTKFKFVQGHSRFVEVCLKNLVGSPIEQIKSSELFADGTLQLQRHPSPYAKRELVLTSWLGLFKYSWVVMLDEKEKTIVHIEP